MLALWVVLAASLCVYTSQAVIVLSANRTQIGDEFSSPHYVRANVSFDVVAQFYIVPVDLQRGYHLDQGNARSRIIIVDYRIGTNADKWARACASMQCAGIQIINADASKMSVFAATAFSTGGSGPFTNLPIVIISVTNTPAFLTAATSPSASFLRIRSGDFNDVVWLDENVPFFWWWTFLGFLLPLVTVLSCILQCLRQAVDSKGKARPVPIGTLLVFVLEALASTCRAIYALFSSVFHYRVFSYAFARYVAVASMSFNVASIGVVTSALNGALDAAHTPSRVRTFLVRVWTCLVFALVCADQVDEVMAAALDLEYLDATAISVLYLLSETAASVFFIVTGSKVSHHLSSSASLSLSTAERARRQTFARRVRLSGWAGACTSLSLVGFALFNTVSWPACLFLFWLIQHAFTVAGLLHVWAFKPKPTRIDDLAQMAAARAKRMFAICGAARPLDYNNAGVQSTISVKSGTVPAVSR
ncbi:Intimal thickness related receptor IRP domain-containing protein [Plasmodiophora brassicae]